MSLAVTAAAFAALSFSPCTAAPTSDGPLNIEKVVTDFGYVAVDSLDIEAAVTEGNAAREAAERAFLLPNVSLAIVEEGCTDAFAPMLAEDHSVHTWAFPNGSRREGPRPPTNVLRHEIGHGLFARYLVPTTRDDQYGTDAPDWLDEMAAIAFEGEDQQRSRRRMAMIDADETGLVPLPRLLRMVHPEYRRMALVPQGQAFSVGSPASQDTLPFYSTIFAFYEFLVERTGSASIVAELASAFRDGEPLDHWILERTGSSEANTLEELDADFLAWFDQAPHYRRSATQQ